MGYAIGVHNLPSKIAGFVGKAGTTTLILYKRHPIRLFLIETIFIVHFSRKKTFSKLNYNCKNNLITAKIENFILRHVKCRIR